MVKPETRPSNPQNFELRYLYCKDSVFLKLILVYQDYEVYCGAVVCTLLFQYQEYGREQHNPGIQGIPFRISTSNNLVTDFVRFPCWVRCCTYCDASSWRILTGLLGESHFLGRINIYLLNYGVLFGKKIAQPTQRV
jgi:hypothetical protein